MRISGTIGGGGGEGAFLAVTETFLIPALCAESRLTSSAAAAVFASCVSSSVCFVLANGFSVTPHGVCVSPLPDACRTVFVVLVVFTFTPPTVVSTEERRLLVTLLPLEEVAASRRRVLESSLVEEAALPATVATFCA